MPLVYSTPVKWGCPYDCGLCTDHEQHSCLTLVEICDYCNLRCPVCYAASGPERQQFRTLPQIEKMLDAVVRNEGHPDVVQLSGGEPTVHPDFFTVVEMAKARPIKHLMVNTNGVRIAQEEDFVKRLADLQRRFRSLSPVRFLRARAADATPRRRPPPHPRGRPRKTEPLQHRHEFGGHAKERPERPRNRQDHRLRPAATLRPRRHLPTDPRRRPPGNWVRHAERVPHPCRVLRDRVGI